MHILLRQAYIALICTCCLSTVLLYTYPAWRGCAFPRETPSGGEAPFRLLALGDPQLEGESSLENPEDPNFPSLVAFRSLAEESSSYSEWATSLLQTIHDLVIQDFPRLLRNTRKRLDLLGNDYYLAHIYRCLHHYLKPTHVTVLGDLLGSQWIDDDEFGKRAWRYWNRVFSRGQRVDDATMDSISTEWLGGDHSWQSTIINIAGNHDIGYSGDLTRDKADRFQMLFGKVNWAIRFHLPVTDDYSPIDPPTKTPELWLVVLNSMNLDSPALDGDLQTETYNFINDVITASYPVEDRTAATIVLTHVPLYKEPGVCVDGPFFDFYGYDEGGGVKEQNHLSISASKGMLEGIYGMSGNRQAAAQGFGRNGIILNGHDHEGCDTYHYVEEEEQGDPRGWKAKRFEHSAQRGNRSIPGIREVTVRSMMGDFGGNAGLVSAFFDREIEEWHFEYAICAVGRQHIWWAVHVLDLIVVTFTLGLCVRMVWQLLRVKTRPQGYQRKSKRIGGESPEVFVYSSGSSTSITWNSNASSIANRRGRL